MGKDRLSQKHGFIGSIRRGWGVTQDSLDKLISKQYELATKRRSRIFSEEILKQEEISKG